MNFSSVWLNVSHVRRLVVAIFAAAPVLACGCTQPIYDVDLAPVGSSGDSVVADVPPVGGASAVTSDDDERYDWPLSRTSYVVRKPPPMAYLTAFSERPQITDPVTAPVVPWDDEGLDPRVSTFLHDAYDPFDPAPAPDLTIPASSLAGPNAFDLSSDGTRLVAIDSQGLALYRVETGELIGHMPLPSAVASITPAVDAVRFAGEGRDLMVGSAGGLFRISGTDGTVVASHAGCGDAIADWQVTLVGDEMLIRTAGGQLFVGNCDLSDFQRCTTSKSANFSTASLSSDGTRIGVVVDQSPRVYRLVDNQLVDQEDFRGQTLGEGVVVGMGLTTDCWTDGQELLYHKFDAGERTGIDRYPLSWRPKLISATTSDGLQNSLLVVAERPTSDGVHPVLYDLGPMSRNSSKPIRLRELPIRMAHSKIGSAVALLGKTDVDVYARWQWRCRSTQTAIHPLYQVMYEGKFDEIERMFAIIRSQSCLGFTQTPVQLVHTLVKAIARQWAYLENDYPDSEYIDHFERWRDRKSAIAMTASAVRHRNIAWEARGSGYSNTVTQKGWEIFGKRMKLAMEDVNVALEADDPPINAYESKVIWTLDNKGNLDAVDEICREASELFPGASAVHQGVLFRLLPQWYGEPGDPVNFCRWASLMVERPHSDWLYAELVGTLFYNLSYDSKANWTSFDAERFDRGLLEKVRREEPISGNDILAWWHTIVRQNDPNRTRKYARIIISGCPVVYHRISHGDLRESLSQMMSEVDAFYADARHQTAGP